MTGIETPCRESPPSTRTTAGYGQRRRRGGYLHRWVWEQVHGPIPAGMVVRHRCDRPACFRLDHLALGTQADNMRDMAARGRGRGQFVTVDVCKRGHPLAGPNLYEHDGKKHCRACRRDAGRRYRGRRSH